MMLKHFLNHRIFINLSIRRSLMYRGALYGGGIFVALLTAVFYKLWGVVFSGYNNLPFSFVDAVWYVATTEAILNATDKSHKQVELDVKNGDIAYFLNRPTSYILMRQAEVIGKMLVSWVVYLLVSWGGAFALTQDVPMGIRVFPFVVVFGFLGAYLHQLFISICGISSLWLQDAGPAYMVYSKFIFLFGGLLFPLDVYPEWMQEVAYWTPAGVILYGPASLLFHSGFDQIMSVAARLLFWIILAVLLNVLCFKVCEKRMSVNGG